MGDTRKSSGRARIPLPPTEIPRVVGFRKIMGIGGGIVANRHRAVRPSFPALIADGDPLFLAPFPRSRWPGDVVPGKVDISPPIAAIRGRKEGPVNWRGSARDFRGYWRWEIMDNRNRAGRTALRALLDAEGPLFPAPLPRRRGGAETKQKWANGGIHIRD